MRVRLKIALSGRSVEAVALVNTGFEGDAPELLIPLHVAERLGIWPTLPEDALIETYRSASGLMRVYRVKGAEASLIAEDVRPSTVPVYLAISEYTDEVLINDQLTSCLGIVIEDPAEGLWRLRGEAKIRRSALTSWRLGPT
ncbi:MAG: hypothetical protein N3H31_05220 [Candidatus Nezhaarchaeota archaeon]|nr:hypothetical protein [Candidatus Nezhaarchaeota archaeon]